MGYCLPVLLRILGPQRFIEQFLASFTWRGSFNHVCQNRCDEYMTAYNTYQVHHKYYHDDSNGSLKDKQQALQSSLSAYPHKGTHFNEEYLTQLTQIILSFSETNLGEICYLFHVWKDNLLIPIQWSPDKVGPAWNIKRIFQDILKQNPKYKKSLKYNQNFRMSMNIIERSDRIYNTTNEQSFYALIMSQSDELSNGPMEGCGGSASLPVWKSPYPVITIDGKPFELISNNTFCNDEWIDDTQIFVKKHQIMNNCLFEKNKKVELKGLKSKPQWNGLTGMIEDDYNFHKERWLIRIGAPVNQCALIKTCNLIIY
eukprot:181273_1